MSQDAVVIKVDTEGTGKISANFEQWTRRCRGYLRQGVPREALRLQSMMREGIRNQAPGGKKFKPLAPSTIAMKGSSKALIDRGDLLRSINVNSRRGGLTVFVGVNRRARNRDGQRLANIAEIHEFGTDPYKIEITNRMRFWWLAQAKNNKRWLFGPLKRSTTHINHPGIPERSFIRASYDEWVKDAEQNILEYVTSRMMQ